MLGTERCEPGLLDALELCGALVPEGSVYWFLALHRRRLFGDLMFADLFNATKGRFSVPGPVVATVMVLQALEGCSDREAVLRLQCDLRWKVAAGLGVNDKAFDFSVLSTWRMRLRNSERPERIFDAVREVAAQCGVLSKRRMRALDSTVLFDAVTTQNTTAMISAQIRRVRKLVPQAAAVVLSRDYDDRSDLSCDWGDLEERAWFIDALVSDARHLLRSIYSVDLNDAQARAVELLGLVAGQDVEKDPKVPGRWRIARRVAKGRVISTVDTQARHARKSRSRCVDGYKAHIIAEPETGLITAALLTPADTSDAHIGPQLLDSDPDNHHPDTNTDDPGDSDPDNDNSDPCNDDNDPDPDTNTDDPTNHHPDTNTDDPGDPGDGDPDPGDGDPDPGDCNPDPGDCNPDPGDGDPDPGDGDPDPGDCDPAGNGGSDGGSGIKGKLALGDSAYASGEALQKFTEAGYDTAVKPLTHKPRIAGGFTREDFTVDTTAQTVTCPAGHTEPVKSQQAHFGELCDDCPLRSLCTTSNEGRTYTVDAYHQHREANKTR